MDGINDARTRRLATWLRDGITDGVAFDAPRWSIISTVHTGWRPSSSAVRSRPRRPLSDAALAAWRSRNAAARCRALRSLVRADRRQRRVATGSGYGDVARSSEIFPQRPRTSRTEPGDFRDMIHTRDELARAFEIAVRGRPDHRSSFASGPICRSRPSPSGSGSRPGPSNRVCTTRSARLRAGLASRRWIDERRRRLRTARSGRCSAGATLARPRRPRRRGDRTHTARAPAIQALPRARDGSLQRRSLGLRPP